ncbi:MAG: Ig-like domain-containing protein [Ignavibacteriaceae bacterium]|nr:Ig-like domain-containing protein [Ignavibacteriaceae bacterium]
MDKYSTEKLSKYIFYFILFLLTGCANQLPPGGGEVDRIPPEVIEVYPANGTTNFSEDYFELTFSEYVDKRSFKDALFISPAFDKNPEIEWSGKTVRVNFAEPLKENITYVATIGTDLVDFNNKNRMARAFNFTFATGNEIDKRIVTGKVYSEKADGVMIFAYRFDVDTLNPAKHKPDYISQAGKSGDYSLLGLAAGKYRIFSVKDEFRDLLVQIDQDKYGIPFKDIIFEKEDSLFSNLNFFLSSADTVAPRLISANMTDKYHLLVNFTEPIDSSLISSPNFYLYDSTANKKSSFKYAFKGSTKPTEIVLVPSEILPVENNVYLFVDTVRDKSGNVYHADYSLVNLTEKVDTIKNQISNVIPPFGTRTADYLNQSFKFFFRDAFDSTLAKTGITFTDTLKNSVSYNTNFMDDATLSILPKNDLEPNKDYIIKIDLNKFIDAAGNKHDSIYIYKFKTISGFDFTGLDGKISGVDDKNIQLILQGIDGRKLTYSAQPDKTKKFIFDRVEAGKYILWAFSDDDSSGTFNYGYPYPFKPAEEFNYYRDTINLRPRWKVSDILFNFKN